MATAAKTTRTTREWTLDERRARSLQLADERGGGMWAVHFIRADLDSATGLLQQLVVEVDSAHDDETRYSVTYDPSTDWAQCSCPAAQNLAPCHHAGKAIVYGRVAADAYAETDDPMNDARHEGNFEAIRPSL